MGTEYAFDVDSEIVFFSLFIIHVDGKFPSTLT